MTIGENRIGRPRNHTSKQKQMTLKEKWEQEKKRSILQTDRPADAQLKRNINKHKQILYKQRRAVSAGSDGNHTRAHAPALATG